VTFGLILLTSSQHQAIVGGILFGLHLVSTTPHSRMTWSLAHPSARQRCKAVPLWLFVACVAIGIHRAEASCGDYLAHPATSLASLRDLSDGKTVAKEETSSERPCNGPNCEKSRPHKPLPSPASPNQISERLLATSGETEPESLVVQRFAPLSAESPQDGFVSELLRPPSTVL